MSKTNAVRILESHKINHSVHTYEVDEEDLSGTTVAHKIGAAKETVFKTLVAEGDKNGINVFCIPVTEELNLKKAAAASGNKKIEMVKVKDLFDLTGYIRGGCSPIGMKKNYLFTWKKPHSYLKARIYVKSARNREACRLK